MSRESTKSHNLISVIWRSSEEGGMIESESKGLRTSGTDGVCLSPRAGKDELA